MSCCRDRYDYVIAGNGAAGAAAVEGIRSVDGEGSILVISGEKHPVYGRPLISYLLEGKTDEARMYYRESGFYEKNRCEVLYGETALAVDPEKKLVTLSGGGSAGYGSLCVAAGSSPFVPPFKGLETVRNRFSFMTLDDALALSKVLSKDKKVLIMGAGLIGLKCAEGILRRVGSVTVADLAPRILPAVLDGECAGIVQKHIEKENVSFILGDTAEYFEDGRAFMKSGRTVDFDILVIAVGVRANVSLVKDAGGAVNRGIVVDTHMRTSIPGIYAAGDCAECLDVSSGDRRVMAIMPNACIGGFAAGVNMAGGDKTFSDAIPMNSAGFFGLHVMTAGTYEGECETFYGEGGSLNRLYVKDGLLKGFIFIGKPERTGVYTYLIRERVPLESIDIELFKKTATQAMFGKKERGRRFGGVV